MKRLKVVVSYNLPPHYGELVIYPKQFETVNELATVQLRNKLKMQLPLDTKFTIVSSNFVELYNIELHKN